jgi:hypothetical protein
MNQASLSGQPLLTAEQANRKSAHGEIVSLWNFIAAHVLQTMTIPALPECHRSYGIAGV